MKNHPVLFLVAIAFLSFNLHLEAETTPEFSEIVTTARGNYGSRVGGDFLVRKDGNILYAYSPRDVDPILGYESTDGGKTWGKPTPLFPVPPGDGALYTCPSFFRLKDGQVLIAYIYYLRGRLPSYGQVYYRRSGDEGKTWSDQFCLTPYPGVSHMHNDRLIRLSSGRILAIWHHKRTADSNDHGGYVGGSFYSDDEGFIWQPGENFVDMLDQGVEVQEPDAVELKDGRILMFARSYSGHPVRAYSGDGGKTWSKGELIRELPMQHASYPTVRRIPKTGDLLFIWASHETKPASGPPRRSRLSTAISRDEGKTFENIRALAEDPEDDFGYQSIEFSGDGDALISFHHREGLRLARIQTEWFYENEQ